MLNPLYQAVAFLLVHIHAGLSPVLGAGTGASWALSIVLLTLAMRLLLVPLFVKQIRMQRQMQVMQPKIKELQAKYKNDKERLNKEIMAVYRDHGANPLTGCLPLVLQFPIFIGLFHVLSSIQPKVTVVSGKLVGTYRTVPGFSHTLIQSAAHARIFGVPVAAAFTSSANVLKYLSANQASTRILVAILIVVMAATTFLTQRQLMARNSATGTQMPQQQKMIMYVLPVFFVAFGFRFPLGVLLYWVTSNVWALVQQHFVIRRMEPAAAAAGKPAVGRAQGAGSARENGATPGPAALGPRPGQRPIGPPAAPPSAPPVASVGARRPGGGRKNRNRRGRRR
ncbi:MAG TPA: membrane protein insertase YidC [Mycobacteriales bacterium]|nr:membrane protein insertase YidC [Mycobacteriales bacterium]